MAKDLGVRYLKCRTDSQLVAGQISGEYQTREPILQKYYQITRNLILQFEDVSVEHVPQNNNDRADVLSTLASTRKIGQHRTLIQEVLNTPSWDRDDVLELQVGESSWMTPILDFLMNDLLLEDKVEAAKVRRLATSHTIVGVNSSGDGSLLLY